MKKLKIGDRVKIKTKKELFKLKVYEDGKLTMPRNLYGERATVVYIDDNNNRFNISLTLNGQDSPSLVKFNNFELTRLYGNKLYKSILKL